MDRILPRIGARVPGEWRPRSGHELRNGTTSLAHVKYMAGGRPAGRSTRSVKAPLPATIAKPAPISQVRQPSPTPGLYAPSEPSSWSRWPQQPGAVGDVHAVLGVEDPPQPSSYIQT